MKCACSHGCPLCRARERARVKAALRRKQHHPPRQLACQCGKCRKCRHRAYMRQWRAARAPRKGFLRDLDLILPAGFMSSLDPARRFALCL